MLTVNASCCILDTPVFASSTIFNSSGFSNRAISSKLATFSRTFPSTNPWTRSRNDVAAKELIVSRESPISLRLKTPAILHSNMGWESIKANGCAVWTRDSNRDTSSMINLSKNSTPDGAAPRMMLSKIKLRSSIGAALIMRPRLRRRAWNVVIWIGCIVCGWVSGLLIPSRYIVTVFINCLPSI